MDEYNKEKKKIIISSNSSWNLVNFRFNLIKNLVKNGYKIYVLAPRDQTSVKLQNIGCKFYNFPINRKKKSILDAIINIFLYRKQIKKIKPFLFLAFTIKPNIFGSLACKSLNISYMNNITGLGTSFLENFLLRKMVSLLYFFSLKNSKMIFFQNKDDKNLFLKKKIINNFNRAMIIPGSGIEIKKFKNKKNKKKNKIYFLFVGRLIKHKGIYELIQVTKKIKKKYKNVELLVLGDNDEGNSFSVSDQNLKLWIEKKIIKYLGFKKNISNYISNCDCLILPSYREGMSRALLEAALLAKPLIASNVPGCKQLVKNNYNGFLCKPKDINSLYIAIKKFIHLSSNKRKIFGANSRKIVIKSFDEKIVINKYLEEIKKL